MKIRFPHIDAVRLRIGGLLLASVLTAFAGAYSMFYRLTSPERLQSLASAAVADGGRSFSFDERRVSRRLFPRPTVILRDLHISRPNSTQTAVRIEEMRVGMAWKSLFGREEIEKWVWVRPTFRLESDENGHFNLEDLLTADGSMPPINRLYADGAEIEVQTPRSAYVLSDVKLRLHGLSSEQMRAEAEGRLKNGSPAADGLQSGWTAAATLLKRPIGWESPDFRLKAGGQWKEQPFSLRADGRLTYLGGGMFTAKPLEIKATLPMYQTHITAAAPYAQIRNGMLSLPEASAVMTSDYRQAQWDGTLSLAHVRLLPTAASIGKLTFSGSRKDGETNLYATLSGPFHWQRQQGWTMNNLNFGSRAENTLGKRNVRFHSEFSGHFSLRADGGWQGRLNGLFDRQPALLEAAYSPPQPDRPALLSGTAEFSSLQLNPYLENGFLPFAADKPDDSPLEALRQGRLKIDGRISAKSLQWEGVEMNGLDTAVQAENRILRLPDFQAGLYGGKVNGSIEIGLTEPLSYRLRQTAENVQIRPLLQDIFRYGRISGRGRAAFDLQSKGSSRAEWLENMKGSVELNLHDGALWGLDLNNVFAQENNAAQAERFTPFKRFIVSSEISDGISRHREAKLFSDTLNVVSQGEINFNSLTLNEKTKLFPQNGKGRPVPLDIRGPIDNPSVTVDYGSLTAGLPNAAAKQQAVTETLKEQWLWLKPRTPATPSEKGKTP